MSSDTPASQTLPVEQRLFSPGKKRILTLDGGGVRGIVTIAFLKEIEKQLRNKTGNQNLVLADVFDQIAGTSVGSMIATMLALGYDVAEIENVFRDLAPKIFSGRETIFGQKRFDARALVNGVRAIVKDERLGSEKLKTGLVLIAKRVDTGSVWVMSNNPRMPYYQDGADWDGNKHYKLENLIRASTAAPFLFTPTKITIHTDQHGNTDEGWFVDGGISPHNNPSLQALLMAALPSYKLNWELSPDELLMISIGTGHHRSPVDRNQKQIKSWVTRRAIGKNMCSDVEEAAFAAQTLRSIISDNGQFILKVMQALSNPRFSWFINSEVNSLEGEFLMQAVKGTANATGSAKDLLSFQRYDLPLEKGGLVPPQFDVTASQETRLTLHAIDDPTKIDTLYELASDAAAKQVNVADFEGFI